MAKRPRPSTSLARGSISREPAAPFWVVEVRWRNSELPLWRSMPYITQEEANRLLTEILSLSEAMLVGHFLNHVCQARVQEYQRRIHL